MKLQTMLTGIKSIHWSWWTLWLGSITLLGLTILWHQWFGVTELAEQFRPKHFLLPVEFCLIKNMAKGGVYAALMSSAFVFAAVVERKSAPLSKALALGVIMLYFAFHTMAFMVFSYGYMRGYLREHAQSGDRVVPGKAAPARE